MMQLNGESEKSMESLRLFGKPEIPGKSALSIFKKFKPQLKLAAYVRNTSSAQVVNRA